MRLISELDTKLQGEKLLFHLKEQDELMTKWEQGNIRPQTTHQ